MAKRGLVLWPNAVLKTKALPVETFDADLKTLVDDLFETMNAYEGGGLAAPQVGVGKRVFVVDVTRAEPDTYPMAFINPTVLPTDEKRTEGTERCLSIPGVAEDIKRYDSVRVNYFDVDGKPQEIVATGILAVAIQHENDHLDGKVMLDYVSQLRRSMARQKMTKLMRRIEKNHKAFEKAQDQKLKAALR